MNNFVVSNSTAAMAKTTKPKLTEPHSASPYCPHGSQPSTPISPAAVPGKTYSTSVETTSKAVADSNGVAELEGPSARVRSTAYAAVVWPTAQEQTDPNDLIHLNIRRQFTGRKRFVEFQKKYNVTNPLASTISHTSPSPSSSLSLVETASQSKLGLEKQISRSPPPTEKLNMPHLQEGLRSIFRPFRKSTRHQTTSEHHDRMQEISTWMREFDLFIASSRVSENGDGGGKKGLSPSLENGMVDLLAQMNDSLETCEDDMRRIYYRSVKEVGFENTLEKLLEVFRSVRSRGAVEEFLDVMEEWEGSA